MIKPVSVLEARELLGLVAAVRAESDAEDLGVDQYGDATDYWLDLDRLELVERLAYTVIRTEKEARKMPKCNYRGALAGCHSSTCPVHGGAEE